MLSMALYFLAISSLAAGNLLDRLSYFQYSTFQTTGISWEQLMRNSLDMALKNCQEHNKWQRWNCPSNDFLARQHANTERPEREDVYVAAMVHAAILYTITKECASGSIVECACAEGHGQLCAHDPIKALELYEQHFPQATPKHARTLYVIQGLSNHNLMVISALLEKSLVQQCYERQCVQVLKPFAEIAQQIHEMYDEAIQLGDAGENLKIIWENIPLDTLIYVRNSRNYCERDVMAQWPGTRGRQCTKTGSSADERQSCTELCRACGYRIRTQHVRQEQRCNCKVIWGFQLQCEVCIHLERQYYCY